MSDDLFLNYSLVEKPKIDDKLTLLTDFGK